MYLSAVIMSDYFDLPFNDILDWKKFSVILKESDVHGLKRVLLNIPDQEYQVLQTNTVMVLHSWYSLCKMPLLRISFLSIVFLGFIKHSLILNCPISLIASTHDSGPGSLSVESTTCQTWCISYGYVWTLAPPLCYQVLVSWSRRTTLYTSLQIAAIKTNLC